jgi:hypothetical protein
MTHTHTLSTQNHFDFLNQDRKDPITGDLIKENDEVVICASCKSAFLKESWGYLGNRHCEQNQTLAIIPERSNLELKTGLLISLHLVPEKIVLRQLIEHMFLLLLAFAYYNLDNANLVSIFLIVTGIVSFLIYIIMQTIKPTTRVELYSTYLISKGLIGGLKLNYEDIKYVHINCFEVYSKVKGANHIYIKHTNNVSTVIDLEAKQVNFDNNEEVIDFINLLARHTPVTLKIHSRYKEILEIRNIPAKIEWI